MPVVGRAADWRIDLQVMRLSELLQPRVQCFAEVDGIVIRGMNEKDWRTNVCHGREQSRSQFR